ncbi:MAG TPA: TlpA family protein disulfide reductase [Chromatiales bacterium]|nr:TlpA family protein disulfide reductase [Thiotrichales bacterium]HIP67162.1 TlpA family protein disulfide reductase [Chromatiales bacterium]
MFFRTRNQSTRRRAITLVAEVLFFLLIYLGVRAWMQRDMVEGQAPIIQAVDVAGQSVSLSDFHGQPLLLHFWASWCRICQFEQGAVSAVAADWPVLTIAMQSGNSEQVRAFMEKRKLNWQTVVDESGELANKYGVAGVPTSFILDGDGEIRFHESGYTTSAGLRLRLWLTRLLY